MTELIKLEKLQPNPWNPNVMQKEEYEALKQDMHVHGINGVDPLLVSPSNVFHGKDWEKQTIHFDIVDGEHRFKAAGELGWKEIRCDIQNITEEDAKALCYRRNRERGTLDPFKEAFLFKSEENMTQAQVAGKYGIEQGTVSHRLSLLKLEAPILKKLQNMPRGIITTSHMEAVATLHPEDQKALMESIERQAKWNPMDVEDVERAAQSFKRTRKEKEDLEEALKTAKYPNCPVCKEKAQHIEYKGLPWVTCGKFHTQGAWNLKTGKTAYEPETRTEKTLTGETRKVQSTVIRSIHTCKELHAIFAERIREVVPKLQISTIRVSGKLEGASFSFDLDGYENSMSLSWHLGNTWEGFHAEKHDYRGGEKTCIHAHSPEKIPTAKELIENAFKGKLGIESKRLKNAKEVSETPQKPKTCEECKHLDIDCEGQESNDECVKWSEPFQDVDLEAKNMKITEDPKQSLAGEE